MRDRLADTPSAQSARFIEGLARGDLALLRTVPKGDLHNHSWMGGRLSYVEERLGVRIEPPPRAFPAFADLLHWILRAFLPHVYEAPQREIAVEAALVQAAEDGVTVLGLSFGALMQRIYGGEVHRQAAAFRRLHERYAPQVELRPVLGLNRAVEPEELMRLLDLHLESEFYTAVDLYGDEFARPIRELVPVFRRARDAGLRLMAHVGEYGDAESVREAVNELELDEVQHGIAAAAKPPVMRFLADHGIPLHVCPTSTALALV